MCVMNFGKFLCRLQQNKKLSMKFKTLRKMFPIDGYTMQPSLIMSLNCIIGCIMQMCWSKQQEETAEFRSIKCETCKTSLIFYTGSFCTQPFNIVYCLSCHVVAVVGVFDTF